jgi:hypothetical protein
VFAWFTSTQDHQSTAFDPDVYMTQQKNRPVSGQQPAATLEVLEVF